MKKKMRYILLFIAALFVVWNIVLIKFTPEPGESVRYKESDTLSYYWFTDKVIKNAPRISNDYQFEYRELDGSSPRMSVIEYHNATNAHILRKYMKKNGFTHTRNNYFGEVWENKDDKILSLSTEENQKVIALLSESY